MTGGLMTRGAVGAALAALAGGLGDAESAALAAWLEQPGAEGELAELLAAAARMDAATRTRFVQRVAAEWPRGRRDDEPEITRSWADPAALEARRRSPAARLCFQAAAARGRGVSRTP